MTDPDKIFDAVTESAKFGTELVKAGREAGAYVASVLGDLPHNLVRMLVADKIAQARMLRLAHLEQRAREKLRSIEQGDASIENAAPTILIQIASAAADETREPLIDLWASLLAAAMNPKTASSIRQSHIDLLKQFDPPDALYFRAVATIPPGDHMNRSDIARQNAGIDTLEAATSLARLRSLQIVERAEITGTYQARLTDLGASLARSLLE